MPKWAIRPRTLRRANAHIFCGYWLWLCAHFYCCVRCSCSYCILQQIIAYFPMEHANVEQTLIVYVCTGHAEDSSLTLSSFPSISFISRAHSILAPLGSSMRCKSPQVIQLEATDFRLMILCFCFVAFIILFSLCCIIQVVFMHSLTTIAFLLLTKSPAKKLFFHCLH